jgi:hypothetical protein
MTIDFALPKWNPPGHQRPAISDKAYLTWLSEERSVLMRNGQLEKLKADPARRPVNARFVL